MDGQRFDMLARSLATRDSRRSFIRTAIGLALGGVGIELGTDSADAKKCVRGGKKCKKHSECCSGQCDGRSQSTGTTIKNGTCCVPDSPEVSCADTCGNLVLNNCGLTVDCGKCPGEICAGTGECASGECLGDVCCPDEDLCPGGNSDLFCCPADRSSTAACCPGTGECCDCFQDKAPGGGGRIFCGCEELGRELCGTYPNDECCQFADTCVNGDCIPDVYACPPQTNPSGANVNCLDGCCGGVCCPSNMPECIGNDVKSTCVAQL